MSIDLNSLSHFWLVIDNSGQVTSCSEYLSQLKINKTFIKDSIIFHQPIINQHKDLLSQIQNKLLIINFANKDIKFRSTCHRYDNQILLIAWPFLKSFSQAKEHGLTSFLTHPACQQSDVLIVKDILTKSQEKIYEMQVSSMEQKLNQQKKINKHQSKLASLGELSAGIGHEINNPLVIAIGNNKIIKEMLTENEFDKEKLQKLLEKQTMAHLRIQKIVNGLRLYAREDSDNIEIFSLNEIIESTLYLISDIYEKDGVYLKSIIPKENYYIQGVPGEFQQVILNLIKNAKDSLVNKSEKSIIVQIQTTSLNIINIEVTDNGSGIPKEMQDKIFDPFYTSKKVGEGTGLGLGISHDFILKMNGNLTLKSQVDIGTTFKISLPIQKVNLKSIKKQQNHYKNIEKKKALSGKVLILDDEPGVLEILKLYLENLGLDVDDFSSAQVALENIKLTNYDFICSDLKMPEMMGHQFIKEARKVNTTQSKYFLVTGGMSKEISSDKDFLDSLDGIIDKPFDEDSLHQIFITKEKLDAVS